MTKTMISDPKALAQLEYVGYFISGLGGAPKPYQINEGIWYLEWICAGEVFPPEGGPPRGVGWIFLHSPGDYTVNRSPEDMHYECATFSFRIGHTRQIPDLPKRIFWSEEPESQQFASGLLRDFHERQADPSLMGLLVIQQLAYRASLQQRSAPSSPLPSVVLAAMRRLKQDLQKTYPLKELAAELGLSVPHLSALFREHLGVTPHQIRIRERMKRARYLLLRSNHPVKWISAEIGYGNPENFCRIFRKHHNESPGEYRERYRIPGRIPHRS